MGRLSALAGAIIAGMFLAWLAVRPPAPADLAAPAQAFSAERAMADVRALAQAAHPTGSAANARVRDHLLRRMAALDLSPETQVAEALHRTAFGRDVLISGGRVENLVGVLPGRHRAAPALLIMAHYDSTPNSPGAADDAAGVAAALETIRALKSAGAPARDVAVVFTDGEEIGLLGAKAFFRGHPLAKRVGLVLNLEARGGGGRALMFQTGPQNGQVIDLLRRTAAGPTSNSLAVYLYQQMPNDTDFSEALDIGLRGMNFAFLGRQFDYHAPTSTPQNLDAGSLQHLGDQLLATARGAGLAERLPQAAPDRVYSHLVGDLLVAYPAWAGWLVLAAAAALLALAITRSGGLGLWEAVRGVAASAYLLALAGLALRLAREATGFSRGYLEQRPLLAQAEGWETALALTALGALLFAATATRRRNRAPAAVLPLAAALACSLLAQGPDALAFGLGVTAAILALVACARPLRVEAGWAGALVLALAAACTLQILAPPTAFMVAWPLLLASALAAATRLRFPNDALGGLAFAAVVAVALGWLLSAAHLVFLGLDLPELLALFAWLAALLLWPLAAATPRRLALAMLALAVLAVAVVRFEPPWSARHPQASHLAYVLEPDRSRAWWASTSAQLSAWERAALGQARERRTLTPWPYAVWATPAPLQPLAAPPLAVGPGRTLRIATPPGARTLSVDLQPDPPLTGLRVNGIAAGPAAQGATRIRWSGGPLALSLPPGAPQAATVKLVATYDGWPPGAPQPPARPTQVMPFGTSDVSLVAGTVRTAW